MVSKECRRKTEMLASNILFWPWLLGSGVHRGPGRFAWAASDSIIGLCTSFPISNQLLPDFRLSSLGGLSTFFHNDLIFTDLHWTSCDGGLKGGIAWILNKTTRLRKRKRMIMKQGSPFDDWYPSLWYDQIWLEGHAMLLSEPLGQRVWCTQEQAQAYLGINKTFGGEVYPGKQVWLTLCAR